MLSDFPEPEEVELPARYFQFEPTGEVFYYTLEGEKVYVS